jgi:hypothetical protein
LSKDPIEQMRETGDEVQSTQAIQVMHEDGTLVSYWIMGLISYKENKYAILVPTTLDENGQMIDPAEEEDDGRQKQALLVSMTTEENGDQALEQVDPDSELATELMDRFHAEGWIAYPEDDEAEEELDQLANKALSDGGAKNAEMHEKYSKALGDIDQKLNRRNV